MANRQIKGNRTFLSSLVRNDVPSGKNRGNQGLLKIMDDFFLFKPLLLNLDLLVCMWPAECAQHYIILPYE